MSILHRALVLSVLVCAGCAPLRGLLPADGTPAERLAASVSIVRDSWGVPYILARTDAGAMFGLAYAQAEDDYWQIEEDVLHALGRASHWYGERVLASDLVMRAFEVEGLARDEYAREPPERRALWDAFAAGINHYVRTSDVRPRLITTFEPWMPFALVRAGMLTGTFDGVRLGELAADAAADEAAVQLVGIVDSARERSVRDESFALAVAPSRTRAGHAVLIESAHASFTGPGRPYEFMVLTDEGWHVRGAAALGTPVPHSGRNEHLAWARTATGGDLADVQEITFDHPTDGAMYSFDGEWRTAHDRVDTLLVNSPAGVVQRAFRFRSTVHGPVVAAQGERSFALRIAGVEEGGSLQQAYAFSRAMSLTGFRAALEIGPPSAVTYADTAGNIMHVPGSADLPHVINPDQGWVASGGSAAVPADSALAFEQLAVLPFDTRVPGADADIAVLAREWEQIGGSDAVRARRLDAVIDVLRSWDALAVPQSQPATLYLLWQEQLRAGKYVGDLTRFRAMEAVLAGLEQHHDSIAVAWGAVNRLQRVRAGTAEMFSDDRPSLGVGGAPAWAGSTLVIDVAEAPVGAPRYAVGGSGWIRAVELGPAMRSQSVVPFGQSGDPASPHYVDQMALYVRGELKRAPFTREDVLSNAARRYSPGDAVRELP